MVFFSRLNFLETIVVCILCMSLPAGYKFLPTEEELVIYYLANKVFCKPIPSDVIEEFDRDDIFSRPPKDVVESFSKGLTVSPSTERSIKECYFFLPQNEDFYGRREIFIMVGNGIGFWKSSGEEIALFNINGVIFALKLTLIYYSGRPSEAKKTHWRMEFFRLPTESYTKHTFKGRKWVLGRMKRGQDYGSYLF